nr:hypothetical protein [Corynebacterium afermentans]
MRRLRQLRRTATAERDLVNISGTGSGIVSEDQVAVQVEGAIGHATRNIPVVVWPNRRDSTKIGDITGIWANSKKVALRSGTILLLLSVVGAVSV